MDIISIFSQLSKWGIPAAAGSALLGLLFAAGYFIYKKKFHGEKTFTGAQLLSAFLLCWWAMLVTGLTVVSRGANFTGTFNIEFLSGYISAWNNWSVSELQLIIFNMLMFVPLGFLLPLLWKKAERFRVTLAVSFALTAVLETFQFLTGTGIFELDDLFHNVAGSIFGYFCIMAVRTLIREKKLRFAPAAKVLLIPCAAGLILGAAVLAYNRQPYGNMSIRPAVKQDMTDVRIVTGWKPSEQNGEAAVYRNKYAGDKSRIQDIKAGLAELGNITWSRYARREDENIGYAGTDENGSGFRVLFFPRTGEWICAAEEPYTAGLKEQDAGRLRRRCENWMKELNLLPENAEFSVQNGDTLRWDTVPDFSGDARPAAFQKGSVMVQFDETGALKNFSYLTDWNEYVSSERIISESSALEQVRAGNFEQYVPFEKGDVLHIDQCRLSCDYDTKGFLQPVYEFTGYINSSENVWTCRIPALAE